MKGIPLLLIMTTLWCHLNIGHSLDTTAAQAAAATCALKDNCNHEETLLSVTAAASDQSSSGKLESKIASLFEDKVNYSLQLFAEETVIDINALDRNLSDITANFTIKQIQLASDDAADDIEENERGK